MKEVVSTSDAPKAIGPFSQAIKLPGFVFASGQIPVDPATGEVVDADIGVQTERVIKNIEAVLCAAGSNLGSVIKTTVYLTDMKDFAEMNDVYARFFTDKPPARVTVEVSRLPRNVRLEIDAIAVI